MGFLDGLGRFVQGKPVFETPPDETSPPSNISQPHGGTPRGNGQKIIPRIEVEETDVHQNGTHMRVSIDIKNHSDIALEIDKIRLLGTKRELDRVLRPHEEYRFVVYEGERPKDRYQDDAWIDYKDPSGDYFQQYHTVEFEQESDRTYSIKRIRTSGPVKDV